MIQKIGFNNQNTAFGRLKPAKDKETRNTLNRKIPYIEYGDKNRNWGEQSYYRLNNGYPEKTLDLLDKASETYGYNIELSAYSPYGDVRKTIGKDAAEGEYIELSAEIINKKTKETVETVSCQLDASAQYGEKPYTEPLSRFTRDIIYTMARQK